MGLAVGATVVAIVISPLGKQSGGHFNPALTAAFYRLGKISLADAVFYVVAQFSGAIGGVCIARYLLPVGRPAIRYAVTTPGVRGSAVAFIGELTGLICSDVNDSCFIQSREPDPLHAIHGWRLVRDFHDRGSAGFRNEYESREKPWTSFACELLARNLA